MNKLVISNIERSYEGYYKINNHHILINPFGDIVNMFMEQASQIRSKKVHMIVTEWNDDIKKSIIRILTSNNFTRNRDKYFIHIPKMCKDIIVLINADEDMKRYNYKIIIEGNSRKLKFVLNVKEYNNIEITDAELVFDIRKNWFLGRGISVDLNMISIIENRISSINIHLSDSISNAHSYGFEGIFSSKYRRNDPELFKNEIIKSFKKQTPNGIIKSFKNDDEIWEFIMCQNEWNSRVTMKDENGETYNGSFDDQMKSLLEDMIGESDHPISTTTEGDN